MARGGYSPKPTIENIKELFEQENMQLLETEYINAKTKMKYICSCGYEGFINWNCFQRGIRCPICAIQKIKDKQKLKYEDVKLEFEKYGFKLLETNYQNTGTPMLCICKCGEETKTTIDAIRRGSGCQKCGKTSMKEKEKLPYEFVKNYFEKFNYKLLEDTYVNWKTKMKYECDKGHINYMCWNAFKNGVRCPDCGHNKKKEYNFVKKFFEDNGYQLLSKNYVNNETPLKYICPKGHKGQITWANFQYGQRCKKCNESKGERKINEYLISHCYNFIREYKIEKCKFKKSLPFDFAIFNDNNELEYLIEYDGEQHFKEVEVFGGKEALIKVQRNDRIKTNYCLKNNIPLLRISYQEFGDIEQILDNFLSNFNQIDIKHDTG